MLRSPCDRSELVPASAVIGCGCSTAPWRRLVGRASVDAFGGQANHERRPCPKHGHRAPTCGIVPNGVDQPGQGGTARQLPSEVAMSIFILSLPDPQAALENVG